jgi:hypothetical protein
LFEERSDCQHLRIETRLGVYFFVVVIIIIIIIIVIIIIIIMFRKD